MSKRLKIAIAVALVATVLASSFVWAAVVVKVYGTYKEAWKGGVLQNTTYTISCTVQGHNGDNVSIKYEILDNTKTVIGSLTLEQPVSQAGALIRHTYYRTGSNGGRWVRITVTDTPGFAREPLYDAEFELLPWGPAEGVPSLTQWGMIALGVLILAAGAMVIVRRRRIAVQA